MDEWTELARIGFWTAVLSLFALGVFTRPGTRPRRLLAVVFVVGSELLVIGTAWPSWWFGVLAGVFMPFLLLYGAFLASRPRGRGF
ncbi:hypothetical protein [Cellulomonas terrae]|nr:hypothetical protein [Cellulomonas terrae]